MGNNLRKNPGISVLRRLFAYVLLLTMVFVAACGGPNQQGDSDGDGSAPEIIDGESAPTKEEDLTGTSEESPDDGDAKGQTTSKATNRDETPAANNVAGPKAEPDNMLNLATLKAGDKVGAFTVNAIEPAGGDGPITAGNVRIAFSGTVTFTATYSHFFDFLADETAVVTFRPTEKDEALFPRLPDEEESYGFAATNYDAIKDHFGPLDASGTAKITITNYVFTRLDRSDLGPGFAEVTAVAAVKPH